MCGHVGAAGLLNFTEEKVFQQLLIMDSLRGTDSTGVAAAHNGQLVSVAKSLGNPYELFYEPEFDAIMKLRNRALIGHNRYATSGKVVAENAHPFNFPTLVGAHNGTLVGKYRLDNSANFAVDSENLFHHIDKHGLDDALKLMEGAWALVWWDKDNSTINFLRNKERPLFFCYNQARTCLFWASESWMLSAALGRNNVPHEAPALFKENVHYAHHVNEQRVLHIAKEEARPSTFVQAPCFFPGTNTYPNQSYGKSYCLPKTRQVWDDVSRAWKTVPVDAVVIPPNNVIALPGIKPSKKALHLKKEGSNLKNKPAVSNAYYNNSKDLVLDLIGLTTDEHGAMYFECHDDFEPLVNIRLYFKAKNVPMPETMLGKRVECAVGLEYRTKRHSDEGFYHKVLSSSVDWTGTPWVDNSEDIVALEGVMYPGHDNVEMNLENWVHKYGCCSWCSDVVVPHKAHILTTEGQSLCAGCASDKEVTEVVHVSRQVM